eukprot:7968419-Pyramimonas_sp.AAC.1
MAGPRAGGQARLGQRGGGPAGGGRIAPAPQRGYPRSLGPSERLPQGDRRGDRGGGAGTPPGLSARGGGGRARELRRARLR